MARGDHIYIHCSVNGIPFQHHGIDMGDGTVIHLAPKSGSRIALRDPSDEFAVRRTSMEEFGRGAKIESLNHTEQRSADEIADAAESMLGQTGYSLLDGNCEHFATLCATGVGRSQQIELGEATVTAFASMAAKAVGSVSARVGGRLALKSATKVHPATLIADGVEVAALAIGCRKGLDAEQAKKIARVSGTVAAAGIGGIVGGPVGAATCLAVHSTTGALAESLCKSMRKMLA